MNLHTSNLANRPADALEARFALRLTALLDESTVALPKDITARLRFAREKAVAQAISTAGSAPVLVAQGSSVVLGSKDSGQSKQWWWRVASLVPLVVLVGGLAMIQALHQRSQIRAAADVDAALLADEVPPTAYTDPGFVEFLKLSRD